MGWEIRESGRRYYTRSRRVNGQVVRQYFGAGPCGDTAAAEDAARQLAVSRQRQEIQAIRAENQSLESLLAQLKAYENQIAAWLLLVAGCHRPKRQWRKKRGK